MGPASVRQVNGQLQSSDPDVYVIGDVAAFPQPRFGGAVTRQEHVQVGTGKPQTSTTDAHDEAEPCR